MNAAIAKSRARDPRTNVPIPVPRQTRSSESRLRTVEIVVPVYNEAAILEGRIHVLHDFLTAQFPFGWRITIVDNASTDATVDRANRIATVLDHVSVISLDRKGRGLALREAWCKSSADVVAYMDVDLSTDLDALLPLVAPLISGHSDISIGSRLIAGASVARYPKREFLSRGYNLLLRCAFATQVRDAQCGFKAMRRDIVVPLLAAVEDNEWFFDTELLLIAERNGLRVHQLPVDWIDDPDSRVHVRTTVFDDLRGVVRLLGRFLTGGGQVDFGQSERRRIQDDFGRSLVAFAGIGAISTLISLTIFVATRSALGAILANLLAVSATFVGNTWANARYSQGARRTAWRPALATYAAAVVLTTVALVAAHLTSGGVAAELVALAITWPIATLGRLVLTARRIRRRSSLPFAARPASITDEKLIAP